MAVYHLQKSTKSLLIKNSLYIAELKKFCLLSIQVYVTGEHSWEYFVPHGTGWVMSSPAPRKLQLTPPHPILPTSTSSVWALTTETEFLRSASIGLRPSIEFLAAWPTAQVSLVLSCSQKASDGKALGLCLLEALSVATEPAWELASTFWNEDSWLAPYFAYLLILPAFLSPAREDGDCLSLFVSLPSQLQVTV